MQITSLQIGRRQSYESDAGQFRATVTLEGPTGNQTVVLSSKAVSRIFGVIAQDVIDTTSSNALLVKAGMDEAINGPLLADSATIKELA